MKIPSKNTWGLVNDAFIYLAHVTDFSIWGTVTQAISHRSHCDNKLDHKSAGINVLDVFSDFSLYSIQIMRFDSF